MPRASKTVVSWQKKRTLTDAQEKNRRKSQTVVMRKYEPSQHPLVQLLKKVEGNGPIDSNTRNAVVAGFQAAHCSPDKFQANREIARVRLPSGEIKRTYACDVCGFVGSKVSQT